MAIDHRIHARRQIDSLIKVWEGKLHYHTALGSDISQGGLCFVTTKPDIKAGQTFVVQFKLLIRGRPVQIEGEVEVIHKTTVDSSTFKVGLAFMRLDILSTRNIRLYLNNVKDFSVLVSPAVVHVWNSLSAKTKYYRTRASVNSSLRFANVGSFS